MSTGINYVRVSRFAELTGYTEKAARRKMEEGIWMEGKHFRRAPDGSILINIREYEKWVETGLA